MSDTPEDVTRLLQASLQGDSMSTEQLASLTYDDLRAQARRMLGTHRPSIDATAIVHEAYLRLIDQRNQDWRSRSHFAAIGSTMLRRVFIDALRARGRRRDQQTLITQPDADGMPNAIDVLDLDAALEEFATVDAQGARIVEMRFFGGMTVREIAEELGIPRSSVQDIWTFARAWLGKRLGQAQ